MEAGAKKVDLTGELLNVTKENEGLAAVLEELKAKNEVLKQ